MEEPADRHRPEAPNLVGDLHGPPHDQATCLEASRRRTEGGQVIKRRNGTESEQKSCGGGGGDGGGDAATMWLEV